MITNYQENHHDLFPGHGCLRSLEPQKIQI